MIYERDDLGRMIAATDDLGYVWVWEYNSDGNIVYHKSPSTEWRKEYVGGREVLYICGSLRVATSYDHEGVSTQTGWPE